MSRAVAAIAALLAVGLGAPLALALSAADPTPAEVEGWLRAVDEARNSFAEAKITARATQWDGEKNLGAADFDIYVKGHDRALIIFRGGKNDGRKALTVGDRMWLLVPGAENPVPITPNQRLMGGASFGDVAQMRFAEDFIVNDPPTTEKV